jgi:glycine hydroxymethyltransferase
MQALREKREKPVLKREKSFLEKRALGKSDIMSENISYDAIEKEDSEIFNFLNREVERQKFVLNMIPSENYVSKAVLEASGSILTNKYAEGYPGKRYYQGMANVDEIEKIAIERAKKLFGAEHANVQPYSGSPANAAIYYALLKPGDKIMGMRLDMGGHLTHGHKVNFSARFYKSVQYTVDKETQMLDMDEIRKLAIKEKPKLIISGYTAYPRKIPFKEFHEIAEEVGAYSMADISHISGLIVGGVHPSPLPFTDVVMTTTHKTLRGPRGAIILSKKEDRLANVEGLDEKQAKREKNLALKIDRAVFPGLQGGPHINVIAAKAVAFKEAMTPEFKEYARQVVKNAKVLAETLLNNGIKLVTGGTDNHLILIDLTPIGIGVGKQVAVALENAGIVTNMNTIPYDPSTPFKPSGLRIGTPLLTTRGMKEEEMKIIGEWISKIIRDYKNDTLQNKIKEEVKSLCEKFPFY